MSATIRASVAAGPHRSHLAFGDSMTQHTQASIFALVCGVVFLLGGLFGIYYQGPFWASGPVAAMNPDEDALALGLPAGVTLAGGFFMSYVILASPLTTRWTIRKRAVVFVAFASGVLVACGFAAWLAGRSVARKLQTTEVQPNPAAALDGGSPVLLATPAHWPAASEPQRWA
jgi:hypothetical protein